MKRKCKKSKNLKKDLMWTNPIKTEVLLDDQNVRVLVKKVTFKDTPLFTDEQIEELSNKTLFSFFLEASEYIDLSDDKLLKLKANEEMLNTINLFLEHIHNV